MTGCCHASLASILMLFAAAGMSACQRQPDAEEFRVLPARFADEHLTEPLVALDVYRDDESFYVRYRMGDDIYYTGGSWSDRIDLDAITAGENQTGPFILPLQYHRRDRWARNIDGLIATRVLSAGRWQEFRDLFFASELPRDEAAGVVLHFQVDDYFLYFDENGVFQSKLLVEKPPHYSVREEVEFSQFMARGIPLLDKFLTGLGITDRRVVFNTGDTGAYSLPFLYVNVDLPLAVFARREPEPRQFARSRAVPLIQTAGHLTSSHSTAMLFRPISSVYRLLFVAGGAVAETARPDWLVALESIEIPPLYHGPGMDIDEWERQLTGITGRKPIRGEIEYLVDGEAFFTRLIEAITSAEDRIDLRTYIFDNDDYAERIGRLLKRRSNEGLNVRLLFDGIGTILATYEEQDTLPEEWNGAASVRAFLEAGSRIDVRQSPNPWLTGDHVKTIIIDGKLAFTGGMNIAREYRYDWHDVMMQVRGPVVDTLQREFNKAWAYAGVLGDYAYFMRRLMPKPNTADHVGYPVRVLYTRVDDHEIFRAQREAIRNARRRILVENAYLTDDAMLYELVKARRRGVDVRVIMPLVTDRGPITRNNALAANVMLEHGIRVYVYPGMSHVKAAVFDGWACLGSANWDKWSLAINKELNLATSQPNAVQDLVEQVFEPDMQNSPELTAPFPERWSDHLLEFMGDYIF